MNKHKALIILIAITPISGLYGQSSFSGIEQLVGHCWQAPFADQKKHDTHCFEWMYGQSFIKDQHLVCGDGANYAGMTIYSSADNRVKYRYFNSLGGISDGEVKTHNAELLFPEEIYKNGSEQQIFSTKWKLLSDSYISIMSQIMADGISKPIWEMTFKQIDINNNVLIKRDRNGNLMCK